MAFLLSLRGTLTVSYKEKLTLTLRVLFVKVRLYPKKDKTKKARSMSAKKAERIEKKIKTKSKKKLFGGVGKKKDDSQKDEKKSIGEILETLQLSLTLIKTVLGKFFGHLRVRVAKFNIKVATADAATTAVAYGAVCQVVSTIIAVLEQAKNINGLSRKEINIESDFVNDTPTADIKVSFSIRVWQILHVALSALLSLIKHKLNSAKKNGQITNTKNKSSK